jgi:hypothetical protein
MVLLKACVEAGVPIQTADEVWSEFIRRSTYGAYAKGFSDVAASLYEIDADDGTVTFEAVGERLVRVSVVLEFTPRGGGDPVAEVASAQASLERDLEKYRVFLLRRCGLESLRSAQASGLND